MIRQSLEPGRGEDWRPCLDYKHKALINISGILFARSCLLTPLNSLLAAADRNATLPIAEHRTRPLLPFFPPGDPWAGPSGATGRAPSAPTHISASVPPPDTNADNSSWPAPPLPPARTPVQDASCQRTLT